MKESSLSLEYAEYRHEIIKIYQDNAIEWLPSGW